MTRRVWISQCLCPGRHAIIASAGEAKDHQEAREVVERPLRRQIQALIEGGALNPWCGLCGFRQETWIYETRRSRFRTLDEAMPQLQQTERENLLTSAVWGDTHRTERPQ